MPETTTVFDLRGARLNEGLSQREIAEELRMSRETYRRIELGEPARPSTLKRVADRFDVKVTDLPGVRS